MKNEKRKTKNECRGLLCRFSFYVFLFSLASCSSNNSATTRPSSVTDRQNSALNDPFGYSPDMKDADISGGKIDQYDRNAMRKDLDHVLNP